MDILYIVIPAYNEAANIKMVIEEWYPIVEKYNGNGNSRLLVIDDGSKDETKMCRIKTAFTGCYESQWRAWCNRTPWIPYGIGAGGGLYFPNGFGWTDSAAGVS